MSAASLKRDVRRTAEEAGSARANGVGVSHRRAELPLKSVETTRVASAAGFSGFLKRTVDIVVSLLAIILLAPVMLLIAILVKLDTPGPVLFHLPTDRSESRALHDAQVQDDDPGHGEPTG